MTPTTTVTAPNFTGSAMQTATAGSVATGSTASYSGSVTQHEVSPQLPRIESFLQPLQRRSVSVPSPFAPSEPLINDAPLPNLLLDERERTMTSIQELEKELDKYRNALESFHSSSAITKQIPLEKLNPGLPALEFTAWPETIPSDQTASTEVCQYLQEAIAEICKRANITVQSDKGIQDQIEAIFTKILAYKKDIEKLNKVKNELARLVHESAEQTSSIQGLKKTLEDKSRELVASQDDAKKAIERLNTLTSTLERTNSKIEMSESKTAEAEKEVETLKKQNESIKCQLELSQSEGSKAKAKIQKLEEMLKKQNDALRALNSGFKSRVENEQATQKQLSDFSMKMLTACEQKITEIGDLESQLLTTKEQLQEIKTGISSVTGCSKDISPDGLIKSVNTLKRKMDASEAAFFSLSTEYQVIKDSEKILSAANSNNEEKLSELRERLKDIENYLRLCHEPLKDRVYSVNADHDYDKRQEPEEADKTQEAADTLLLLSSQSSADAAPELKGLLQKKGTTG